MAGQHKYQAWKTKQYGPIFKLAGYQGVEVILTSPTLCRSGLPLRCCCSCVRVCLPCACS